jgi:HK97 family phage portal protein
MWPWKKREIREVEQPHREEPTDACAIANEGIGLLQKLLNLKGYGALSQSPFFAAINLISSSVGQMHWEVKTKNQDEDVPPFFYADNVFDDCLLTQFMLVKNLIKDVLLYGNGFAYIHRDNRGVPLSLEYLPFGECNIVYNKVGNTLFYQVPKLTKSLVEPINIIHVVMHSANGIEGKSILSFATNTVKLAGNAEKAASDFFGGGMTVHGILSTESPRLTKDQRESIRTAWNESQIGQGTGIAVLESGMKYQQISSNSKDAQLLESRLFNIQEVARWFNISPVLLGDLSKTSYNNLEQAQLQFVTNTLAPYVLMLEQEINRKLILPKDKNKYYIDVVEEDIIKQDKQSQVNYLSTLVDKGIITRNEARKQLGYSPVEGGDELMISYSDPNQNKINPDNKEKNTQENEDEE